MKKQLLSAVIFFSTQVFADEVVFEKNGVTLTDKQIAAVVKDLSEVELRGMRQHPEIFRSFLQKQFDKMVVQAAIADELKADKHFKLLSQMNAAKFANTYHVKQEALAKIAEIKDFKLLAKQTYQSEIEKYQSPQTYDYYHILFVKQNSMENQAKAEEILKSIKDKKLTLAEAAKQYYAVISGTNEAGILEAVNPDKLLPEIKAAVLPMKVGDISEVIETKIGYHIIGLKAVNETETLPYDDKLEARIITNLKTNIYKEIEKNIQAKYNGSEGLKINEPIFESLSKEILVPK